jgi:hypothetical protein
LRRPIEIGQRSGLEAELLSGLEQGQQVQAMLSGMALV